MALRVQKYGGTSVADIERINNVADRVAKAHDQGDQVVVVLSAMAGVTDSLINLAKQASETPDKRELDVLLATGEQTTAALLAMILEEFERADSAYSSERPTLRAGMHLVRNGIGPVPADRSTEAARKRRPDDPQWRGEAPKPYSGPAPAVTRERLLDEILSETPGYVL